MSALDVINDDEFILRRIPPGEPFQKPGPQLTSVNFEPRYRYGEEDLSVSRSSITSPQRLLSLVSQDVVETLGPISMWAVVQANVGPIREIGFMVVPDPTIENLGHALICSQHLNLRDRRARRKLKNLFTYVLAPNEI